MRKKGEEEEGEEEGRGDRQPMGGPQKNRS